MGHRERQLATVLSSHRTSRHVAAPSLSHYASLSFIVRGRQISEVGSQRSEDRDSIVGEAFSRDLTISTIRTSLTTYRLLDLGCKMRLQVSGSLFLFLTPET